MPLQHYIEKLFYHFDNQLGVLSILGSAIAGAGLVAFLIEGSGLLEAEFLAFLAGMTLIVLDYFITL